MDHKSKYFIFLLSFIDYLILSSADTYSVKILTEQYVNVVDSRFLSFTVDPKYLFSSREKYNSKESICMASSLTPAYIRIAGPSTSHMTLHNSTITFTDLDLDLDLHGVKPDKNQKELAVTHSQWRQFVKWAKSTGFDLVFALNNDEKTESGLWDPNTALNILTMADKASIGEMFWQLGYDCRNQTIEEYLNDLETLRVIMETFPPGLAREWRLVGGDVTGCLQTDSKSDFKDYVTLSDEMMDAVMLNGNSSAQQLERMSEPDRLKLLKRLSKSTTPLWLTESPHTFPQGPQHTRTLPGREGTSWLPARSRLARVARKTGPRGLIQDQEDPQLLAENPQGYNELYRAADWMSSLGYSARNGFAVNFRELVETELYEPTLSFYMALLFKNLVGDRVLDVQLEASRAALFAHCAVLRRERVAGALTLYGANLATEPARFSVKMAGREQGGDVMQFILSHDLSGNIIVNGRPMYYEGDIRPVVKRLRPYKTLLINLPPKSLGFWVLANTNIEACHNQEDKNETKAFVEAETVHKPEDITEGLNVKTKRSMDLKELDIREFDKLSDEIFDTNVVSDTINADKEGLVKRIDNLNNDLKNVHKLFESKAGNKNTVLNRVKRQIKTGQENDNGRNKFRRQGMKVRYDSNSVTDGAKSKIEAVRNLLQTHISNIRQRNFGTRTVSRVGHKKVNKRQSKQQKVKPTKPEETLQKPEEKESRKRRSVSDEKSKLPRNVNEDVLSSENEIDINGDNQKELWKILHKIHKQLKDLPTEDEIIEYSDYGNESKDEDQIVVKTKISDDAATINYKEKSKHGLVRSTVSNVMSVLSDLNKNLNRFWNSLNIIE